MVSIDAIHVKIRNGQVTNRPVYVAIGVACAAERDILGLWAGDEGEGAKFWLVVLTETKNRGTTDVCIVVCDGLKGLLPEAINTVWSQGGPDICYSSVAQYFSPRFTQLQGPDCQRHPPCNTAVPEAAA